MLLKNKIALVTGATSGIGEEIARTFAHEGAKVLLGGRKDAIGREIVADIIAQGGQATYVHLEVTDQADWEQALAIAKSTYGGLNILVNNAGTNAPVSLPKVDLDKWQEVMAVNVTAPLIGIEQSAPLMQEAGSGSIINISSLGGMYGTSSTAYSTSKWALRGLSQSAAYTYSDWNIRSNTIEPGFIAGTNMTKAIMEKADGKDLLGSLSLLGRSGETSELANVALFLASDLSTYVTGLDIPVDGGLYSSGVYGTMKAQFKQRFAKEKMSAPLK